MKKIFKTILVGAALLSLALVAHAAPTSTIVQNLVINGLKSSSNPCLNVNSAGAVATTTCGSGGSGATTTINSATGPTFSFATTTDTNLGVLIGSTGSTVTFTPVWIGTLANARIASSSYWSGKLDTNGSGASLTGIVTSVASSSDISVSGATGSGITFSFLNPQAFVTATSTTWLKVSNNGSDINSTSSFRSNLGLTDTATTASSTWYKVANINPTSTISTGATTATGNSFAFATSGPAFSVSCATATCTFSLATSTASVTGALTGTDWTTFNAKQPTASSTINGTDGPFTVNGSTYLNVASSSHTLTLTNLGVQTITGTSNQVSSTAATGTITLSLPQNINPTFNNFVVAGVTSTNATILTLASTTNLWATNATTSKLSVTGIGTTGCLSLGAGGTVGTSTCSGSASSNTTTTVNGQSPTVTLTFATSGQSGVAVASTSVAGAFTWTISQPTSTDSVPGFLSAADHTTFNAKQPTASSTINGTDGPFTISGTTYLNVASSSHTVTLTNLGVQTITGTSNQVSSTAATGTITLSLPQRVDPNFNNFVVAGVTSTNATFTNSVSSTYWYGTTATTTKICLTGDTCRTTWPNGTPAGSEGNVQFNQAGAFGATSTLNFTTSTQTLSLSHASSTLNIGTLDNFSDTSTTVTFAYTGATSTWTVPSGVTSISVSAIGASGGMGQTADSGVGGASSTVGIATGTIPVTPGQVLYFCIGQATPGGGTSQTGGFCGGGAGAIGGRGNGAGGGGMTWVGTNPSFSQAATLVVAGGGAGGGGAAGTASGGKGGNGGNLTGQSGVVGGGNANAAATGGSQSAGGTGANAGTAGQGGASSAGTGGSQGAGGGGGGGYWGGGGGNGGAAVNQAGNGGGGGSNFVTSTAISSSTATSTAQGNGSLVITYSIANTTNVLRVGGHILTGGGTPVVSSCGTNPSIVGNDTAGSITAGSGILSSCVYTFAKQYTRAPSCQVSSPTAISSLTISTTSSTITIGGTSLTSDALAYICLGY
jgi:hypothetical protein